MGEFDTVERGDMTIRLSSAGDDRPGAPGVLVLRPWLGLNDDAELAFDRAVACLRERLEPKPPAG